MAKRLATVAASLLALSIFLPAVGASPQYVPVGVWPMGGFACAWYDAGPDAYGAGVDLTPCGEICPFPSCPGSGGADTGSVGAPSPVTPIFQAYLLRGHIGVDDGSGNGVCVVYNAGTQGAGGTLDPDDGCGMFGCAQNGPAKPMAFARCILPDDPCNGCLELPECVRHPVLASNAVCRPGCEQVCMAPPGAPRDELLP